MTKTQKALTLVEGVLDELRDINTDLLKTVGYYGWAMDAV